MTGGDQQLLEIQRRIEGGIRVDGAAALIREVTAARARSAAAGPVTLDLIAHAAGAERLLRLGDLLVDGRDEETRGVFRALRDAGALAHVAALRLLGCETATTRAGRETVVALAELLGMPVFGTRELVHAIHFGPQGFRERYRHVLVSDAEIRAAAT